MPGATEIKRAIATHAIQADALWACRFIASLPRHSTDLSVMSTFMVYNYLSLFRFEGWKYLKDNRREIACHLPAPTSAELEQSRNTLKLFDVREGVDGIVNYFMNEINAVHVQHFRDIAGPDIQEPPDDLGLTLYGDRVVYTTHGVSFVLGVPARTLLGADGGSRVLEASMKYGNHFQKFWVDRTQALGPSFVDKLDPSIVKSEDVVADQYYKGQFNGAATPGINALLYVFLASLNLLDIMLPLDELPESRQTMLKMRFITLYHAASSLKKLRDTHRADLTQRSLDCITQILDDTRLSSITKGASRTLRDTLVHYKLDAGVQVSEIDPSVPCYGLIEKYLPGYDYATLSGVVTEQIERVAKIFNEWVLGSCLIGPSLVFFLSEDLF